MTNVRFCPRPASDCPTDPFFDAEEAWFWYARCQRARSELARFRDAEAIRVRPCDPDDIYRQVMGLVRRGALTRRHLTVLGRFGLEDRPPDSRLWDEERDSRLWEEALDRLTTPLRQKGIIQ